MSKKCIYCEQIHDDSVEKCCGLSDFVPVEIEEEESPKPVIEEIKEEFEDNMEYPEPKILNVAHELLVEFAQTFDLSTIEVHQEYPAWISSIPYDDLKQQAQKKYEEENPNIIARIKKYLEQ